MSGKVLLRAASRALVSATLLAGVSGCAHVTSSHGDTVQVEVPYIGDLVPGARHYFAWFPANEYCAGQGGDPKLIDLKGSIVTYRCIPRKEDKN